MLASALLYLNKTNPSLEELGVGCSQARDFDRGMPILLLGLEH